MTYSTMPVNIHCETIQRTTPTGLRCCDSF